ncbi:hypothetical protein C8A00DRAFT_33347 [Chaetomidium leptoderma]|uniref:Uncharacterized protein n=1 Tax=Chaetomidium leptoderma TaxID=669021 RepID=A0AAN6ZVV2_9PEZI|nr:hypothetical protein C8A00DRAFT_33347 [Chaetomidium leptoderma]
MNAFTQLVVPGVVARRNGPTVMLPTGQATIRVAMPDGQGPDNKPSVDTEAYRGKVTTAKLLRPSYMNAVLIQSRGRGFFQDSCGNCKWRDHATRCKVEDEEDKDNKDHKEDSSDEETEDNDE